MSYEFDFSNIVPDEAKVPVTLPERANRRRLRRLAKLIHAVEDLLIKPWKSDAGKDLK